MTKRTFRAAIAMTCLIVLGAAGCAETSTRESTGQYINSAAITTKVKTAIARDPALSVFDIGVETYKDEVQLSGFVELAVQKERAAAVAGGVEGVKAVHNALVVKQN